MTLKVKAWNTFSLWIRNRDKKCVCCGSTNQLQAGHFFHNVLDFDEININAQCKKCNHFLSGNLAVYSTYLVKKYGLEEFEKLDIRHYRDMKAQKREPEYYKEIIKKYTVENSLT